MEFLPNSVQDCIAEMESAAESAVRSIANATIKDNGIEINLSDGKEGGWSVEDSETAGGHIRFMYPTEVEQFNIDFGQGPDGWTNEDFISAHPEVLQDIIDEYRDLADSELNSILDMCKV